MAVYLLWDNLDNRAPKSHQKTSTQNRPKCVVLRSHGGNYRSGKYCKRTEEHAIFDRIEVSTIDGRHMFTTEVAEEIVPYRASRIRS
ncbi:hypothetical protein BN14_01021 [Rhizoctonia solani AG-1 IB]|uniref:Uncharacterized protein n=1 Tax=Thanatephorus cucumeris (strain AG1-IB / isolate 7/3/14) TaxID=1108050 RepID=M5BIM2_THACB|nr:hypothetical protein BN14_01021 [Rhizoctonia solani AG-1 IB]